MALYLSLFIQRSAFETAARVGMGLWAVAGILLALAGRVVSAATVGANIGGGLLEILVPAFTVPLIVAGAFLMRSPDD